METEFKIILSELSPDGSASTEIVRGESPNVADACKALFLIQIGPCQTPTASRTAFIRAESEGKTVGHIIGNAENADSLEFIPVEGYEYDTHWIARDLYQVQAEAKKYEKDDYEYGTDWLSVVGAAIAGLVAIMAMSLLLASCSGQDRGVKGIDPQPFIYQHHKAWCLDTMGRFDLFAPFRYATGTTANSCVFTSFPEVSGDSLSVRVLYQHLDSTALWSLPVRNNSVYCTTTFNNN